MAALGKPNQLGVYDFSSPFARAAIIKNVGSPSEERFPLFTTQGSDPTQLQPIKLTGFTGSRGQFADQKLSTLAFVDSISVDIQLGYVPQLEVVLTPPFEEGRALMNSFLVDYLNTHLEVSFGYYSGSFGSVQSPTFRGIMEKPDVSFGEDFTISFSAKGVAAYVLAANAVTRSAPIRPRRLHIIDLAKEYGVDPAETEWELDSYAQKKLGQDVPLSYSGKSALACLYELARQCGCWLNLVTSDGTNDKIKLVALSKLVTNAPVAVLAFHDFHSQNVGPKNGVFPIISASTSTDGIYLGANAKTLTQTSTDKSTRQTRTVEATPKDIAVTGNKESNQVGVQDPSLSRRLDSSDDHIKDEQDAIKEVEMLSWASQIGIQLSLETVGVPSLIPGQIVQVQGLSARIDDKYVVQSLKHTISSDGYTTSIELWQNSSFMQTNGMNAIRAAIPNAYAPAEPITTGTGSGLGVTEPIARQPSYTRLAPI